MVEGPDDSLVAYVSPETDRNDEAALRAAIADGVVDVVRPEVEPPTVVFTPDLPKTHSGKIMRRLLSAVAAGEEYGDTSALRNPEVVAGLETVADGE